MKESELVKHPQPYPPFLPRNLDLMPLLSFQQDADSDLKLNKFFGSASVPLSIRKSDTIRTKDHDITLTTNAQNRNKTDVHYDGGSISNVITQRVLWNEIQDGLGALIPETNIGYRMTVENIPKSLEEKLSEFEYICQYQVGVGNFTYSLRRRFGISNLSNPFRLIQADLRLRGLWQSRFRYLRSILKTDTILCGNDETKGWTEIFKVPKKKDKKYKFPPLSLQLNKDLIDSKWWADLGIPHRLLGRADSMNVEAVVYILSKRKRLIAV